MDLSFDRCIDNGVWELVFAELLVVFGYHHLIYLLD